MDKQPCEHEYEIINWSASYTERRCKLCGAYTRDSNEGDTDRFRRMGI